jgi:hypothetical protein
MGNAGQHSTDEGDDGGSQGEDDAWLENAEGWQSKADAQATSNEGTTAGATQQTGRTAVSDLSANDQSPTENQAVTTGSIEDEPGSPTQSGNVPMEDSLFGPPQSKSKTPANTSFSQQQDTSTESTADSAAGSHKRQSEDGADSSIGQVTGQDVTEQPTDASTTANAEPTDDPEPEEKGDDESVADFSSLNNSDGIADKLKEGLEYFKGGERPYMKYSNAQERIIVVIVEGTIVVSFLYALIAKPSLILWATLSVALYGFYYLWRGVYAIERIADGLDLEDGSPEDVGSDGRVRNRP